MIQGLTIQFWLAWNSLCTPDIDQAGLELREFHPPLLPKCHQALQKTLLLIPHLSLQRRKKFPFTEGNKEKEGFSVALHLWAPVDSQDVFPGPYRLCLYLCQLSTSILKTDFLDSTVFETLFGHSITHVHKCVKCKVLINY